MSKKLQHLEQFDFFCRRAIVEARLKQKSNCRLGVLLTFLILYVKYHA